MKMWKGNGNTTKLLFSLKGLGILHQERRGQVKPVIMEHFNGILFHMFGPVNKQYTNHLSYSPNSQTQSSLFNYPNNIIMLCRENK